MLKETLDVRAVHIFMGKRRTGKVKVMLGKRAKEWEADVKAVQGKGWNYLVRGRVLRVRERQG